MKKKAKQKHPKKHLWLRIIFGVFLTVLILAGAFFGLAYWDYRGLQITKEINAFERVSSSSCLFKKKTEVNIAYITDANYLYPTQVAVYSAIKNKCPNNIYHFYILTDNVPMDQAQKAFAPMARKDVIFKIVPQQKVLDIEFSDFLEHISSAAMLKFMIAEALPEVNRVIYMDSDTVVVKDLADLFNQDLEGNIVGAVTDIATMAQPGYLATIGYRESQYFNAGMFLLDLQQMRNRGIGAHLNEYVRNNPNLVFIDQDAYNVVLRKKIKKLSYNYNCMASMFFEKNKKVSFVNYLRHRVLGRSILKSQFLKLYKDELPLFYRNVFKDVVMFHYFGFSKPWRGKVKKESYQMYYAIWNGYSEGLAKEHGIKRAAISNIGKKRDAMGPDFIPGNPPPVK